MNAEEENKNLDETNEKVESNENQAPEADENEPSVEKQLADAKKEAAEYKDNYIRKCADFDNYRKRMIREKQEAIDYANSNLLTDLLNILDDLDRALTASESAKEVEAAKPLVDGVVMIQRQLKNTLESKYSLVAFAEKGDAFDPEKHEAIASNPAPVKEPCLAEVYMKGYMLKERVLRHAKVMVSMPDGSAETESDTEKTESEEK